MEPLVSIIVPVYNGAKYMREAIDSALAQTYSNVEIIVVNDGSNDGGATRDIALSYGDKIRYFEKENGGVSTALNLGIKNMHGKYFSWLSHDDIYLPEKIQVEIDALRKAGDMSRVVYSNWFWLTMPERSQTLAHNNYRQEFFETGAFVTLFGLSAGCEFLIPKFYFDIYGGFDETFRAVQDYKKWFEMFRGKKLIYIRKPLLLSRKHPESTTNTYAIRDTEAAWFWHWAFYNVTPDDIIGSGLTDIYHLYSGLFTWHQWSPYKNGMNFLAQKLMELPESPNANERAQKLNAIINDSKFENYFPADQERLIRLDFYWRGIILGGNVKFIPFQQLATIRPAPNIRLLNRKSLTQILIDTPIRKKIFTEWFNKTQGGRRA